jgi:protein ImuB
MHAAIWLPRFQLQAVLRASSSRAALIALVDETAAGAKDNERVLHASEAAEQRGVHAGMTTSQAQARCAALVFLHRDAAQEGRAQSDLLHCASLWTPDYESTLPGCCVLDLNHHRAVLGREQISGMKMHEHLHAQSLNARIGFAANADLAMLAAQAAQPVLVLSDAKAESSFLHRLPVSTLRPSAEKLQVLTLWGVRTLGELIKLPRADVTARLGREGMMLWDIASGGRERLLKLVRTPLGFREEMELEHSIECLDPLMFILRGMLQGLCSRLADVWLVAASMMLTLRFDDQTEHQRALHVAEPTRDLELLFRVLQTHLDGLSAAAPMKFVALEIHPTRPAGNQGQLFERALRDPNRFAETLTQIEALLGVGRVGRACLLPSRRTDAFTVVGFNDRTTVAPLIAHNPAALPLRRLRPTPSVRVTVVDGKPGSFQQGREQHVITRAEGPWLLSGDWWDATTRWDKEVWTVQTDDGALYQLARQNDAWVLEGLLG